MLFNSYIFIFAFLPITLFGYFSINRLGKFDLAKLFLCVMSLVFYGYFNPAYLIIILISLFINYLISYALESKKALRKIYLIAGIVFNLGVLAYYKYYDFFVDNINNICKTTFSLKHIILPLGISFFTFQQLSFVIDRYKKTASHYKLIDYISFITFFPQLVAGPIVLHSELVPQFQDENVKQFDKESLADGICIFTVGLAMKVLIADNLGSLVDFSFGNIEALDSFAAFIAAVAFALELYFDFAGYSNMAIGIGKMFRIELPDNFNRPFHCSNNKDTWKCWHITLGRFFRQYVYFPLGGSRKGLIMTLVNTMIVFTLSGLWHGADWTFVLWGVMHGLGICINVLWNKFIEKIRVSLKFLTWRITKIIAITGNFLFFSLSMVFFRSDNIADAVAYFKRLFGGINYYYIRVIATSIDYTELYPVMKALEMKIGNNINYVYLILLALLLLFSIFLSQIKPYRERLLNREKNGKYAFLISLLFAWCIVSFSGVSQFLYFNF